MDVGVLVSAVREIQFIFGIIESVIKSTLHDSTFEYICNKMRVAKLATARFHGRRHGC
jgi:hypothetical protein